MPGLILVYRTSGPKKLWCLSLLLFLLPGTELAMENSKQFYRMIGRLVVRISFAQHTDSKFEILKVKTKSLCSG